jgi:sorbitol-specific phosphotransferase system component IIBC
MASQAQNSTPLARTTLRRQIPKVGARCVNCARRDLCGGYPEMGIPTAILDTTKDATGKPTRFVTDPINCQFYRLSNRFKKQFYLIK